LIEKVHFQINGNELFSFHVKRDDLIDPIISGNKWRKLEYHVLEAQHRQKSGILTFGGAFSNHLIATAKACQIAGLQSIGFVRGSELSPESNETLRACSDFGMELIFVSRDEYRLKDEPFYRNELALKFPTFYVVPEGGKGYQGIIGCQKILKETANNYDNVYLAAGTGTTATGVVLSANPNTQIHVVSALKGEFMSKNVQNFLYKSLFDEELVEDYLSRMIFIDDKRFGGFGKVNDVLINFINEVYRTTRLKLDPIYTGKAFYQLIEDYKSGIVKSSDKILFIHTGGLQGANSWKDKLDYFK